MHHRSTLSSLFLSLPLSLLLSLPFSLSFSLPLSPSISPPLSLSLSLSNRVALLLYLCPSLFLALSLSLSVYLSLSPCWKEFLRFLHLLFSISLFRGIGFHLEVSVFVMCSALIWEIFFRWCLCRLVPWSVGCGSSIEGDHPPLQIMEPGGINTNEQTTFPILKGKRFICF